MDQKYIHSVLFGKTFNENDINISLNDKNKEEKARRLLIKYFMKRKMRYTIVQKSMLKESDRDFSKILEELFLKNRKY